MSGAVSYEAGTAAEDTVCRDYEARGYELAARRWRCRAGEIDVIARKGGEVIFVEVKRAKDFATAAARLGAAQMGRIAHAAEAFLGSEPLGTDTPARFDVALIDGTGRMEILENAFGA